jgi:HTH-type transcriptional regulator, sugar sensing transcriptional regulator
MIEELKEIGLTNNESKVYLALLDLGPSLAGGVSRKTGMHRRTVYDTTEMLIKKGLIGYILKNNRRYFEVSNPNRFMEIINEKENLMKPVVEELLEKYNGVKEKQETNFYKGKAGLKTIFEDQLNYKDILILGASPKAYEVLQFYFKWYDKKRKSKKIKTRIIAYDKKVKRIPLADIRYLPQKYESPVAVNIYGNNVAIILWAIEPIVIAIRSKEIADAYRNYFELMWKMSRV